MKQALQDHEIQTAVIWEKLRSQIPPFVYHYTNFSTLGSVLRKRELWFTHYQDLNDPSELILANNIIKKVVSDFINKLNSSERFWNFFSEKYPEMLDQASVYTVSFCANPDHLPAWRWYGDNCMGYSIGFRGFNFELSEIDNENPKIDDIMVNYDEASFEKTIQEFLLIPENSRNQDKTVEEDLLSHLGAHLISLTPGFKDPGYEAEQEYRLYQFELLVNGKYFPHEIPNKFITLRKQQIDDLQKICLKKEFLGEKTETRRAKSLVFAHDNICEIWVGPLVDFECAKKEIINILNEAGYDKSKIEIKQSKAYYRG